MFDTKQVFDGTELLPLWLRLDEWESQTKDADRWFTRSVDLTDRRLDSSDRVGVRLYIVASALIRLAREHQHLLERTMVGEEAIGVYPHATLNIIRPAFESALTAFWLLDPDDAETRRLRGLRQCWEDHRQSDAWADEVLLPPLATKEDRAAVAEDKAKIAKRYREDADRMGVKWDKVKETINLRDEIGNLSTVKRDPALRQYLRLAWRQLSGVQHGLSYATLRSGQRLGEVPIPGGAEITLVTDDDWLLTACRVSAAAQAWAMSCYVSRTRVLTRRT